MASEFIWTSVVRLRVCEIKAETRMFQFWFSGSIHSNLNCSKTRLDVKIFIDNFISFNLLYIHRCDRTSRLQVKFKKLE